MEPSDDHPHDPGARARDGRAAASPRTLDRAGAWGEMSSIHIHIHVSRAIVDHGNYVIEPTSLDDVVRVRPHHKIFKWGQSSLAFHPRDIDDLIGALEKFKELADDD